MSRLSHRAPLAAYEEQARALLRAFEAGDEAAAWRFKWEHPRFRGRPVTAARSVRLAIDDARLVIAHDHAFETWKDLLAFTESVAPGSPVDRFESAADAVVSGDLEALGAMLQADPGLARVRSMRRHRATLLHYVAANGVEGARQRTPPNAVEVARMLLAAGAEADALAAMYDEPCTTMSMLVSSSHPAEAGLQEALAETLLDHGAALDGRGSRWRSPLMTALVFGFPATAEALVRRGATVDHIAAAAGLGRVEDTTRLLPAADAASRHAALALAAQLGHADVVRLLLDAGEDPDRYNPDDCHSHATPLHQAVWSNHLDVVRLLVERGARLDTRDRIYEGTPLDWAIYGGRGAIADYLRERGAPAAPRP